MDDAGEQIRVSEAVKRRIDRRRRPGESFNDVLERLLLSEANGEFDDGFGRWSDEESDRLRERRQEAKEQRTDRLRERAEDDA